MPCKLIKLISAYMKVKQQQEQADLKEYEDFKNYLTIFDRENKYIEYLKLHNLKDNLQSARAFKEEHKRISNSMIALRHIEANGLQRDFIFFQEMEEFKNKSIDEQIALFPDWYDKYGVRKAVL